MVLDGKLFATGRGTGTAVSVKGQLIDAWYSGKHRRFGGNIQGLSGSDGILLWLSDVSPGSTHDTTAAQ